MDTFPTMLKLTLNILRLTLSIIILMNFYSSLLIQPDLYSNKISCVSSLKSAVRTINQYEEKSLIKTSC